MSNKKYCILIVIFVLILSTTLVINYTKDARETQQESHYYNEKVLEYHRNLLLELPFYSNVEIEVEVETVEVEVEVADATILKPTPRPTVKPTKKTKTTSRNYKDKGRPIKAIVTSYAPFNNKSGMCNDGDPNTTATMTRPKHGTIAADPSRIPYGTKIYVPNYGVGIVEDTGGGLIADKKNIRIDLYMDTYKQAIKWGRKEMTVYILED